MTLMTLISLIGKQVERVLGFQIPAIPRDSGDSGDHGDLFGFG